MKPTIKQKLPFRLRFAKALQHVAHRQSTTFIPSQAPESIVILAKERYGDCIMLTPLIGCLRKKYPSLSIYILTFNQTIFDFFSADSNVTAVYHTKKSLIRYGKAMLIKEFDLFFNPKDHPSTNFLIQTVLIRARHKISLFHNYHEGLYDHLIRLDSNAHESAKNLSILSLLGNPPEPDECKPYIPTMPVSADMTHFLKTMSLGKYTGINISTGHSGGHRTPEQWAEVINSFKNETFVIFSSPQDLEEKRELEQLHKNVLPSPPTKNLYEVGRIVKNLKLLISPDTSLVHVASCFNTPLVALYRQNPADRVLFAPLSTLQEVIVSPTHDVIDIKNATITSALDKLLVKLNGQA
jgi:heptosyltransferase-3